MVLGVVFVLAGWSKLRSPLHFTQVVRAYEIVPEWLAKAIGYGLPVLEVALGALLIIGIATRIVAAVCGGLLVVFLIALISAPPRHIRIQPGLLSTGALAVRETHYLLYILIDIVLLALAVFLVLWPLTHLSLDGYFARHDYVEPPSAKRMRSEQGHRKYLAQVAAKQREARIRNRYIEASLGVVVVLVVIIGIGVQSGRAKIVGDPSTANASAKYGVVYGKPAAARVDIYEDYQCAACREFAQQVNTTLEADVKANRAQVHYYPLALLDVYSAGGRYSSRAANAALCAADAGVDEFVRYRDILFGTDTKGQQVQPPIGQNRPDADLIEYATQAKFTKAQVSTFTTCVQTEEHAGLVRALNETASVRGVSRVPKVRVNGKTLAHPTLASLTAAIAAADAKGPAPKPSPAASSPGATSRAASSPPASSSQAG
jgi:protein-disulfide isomerase/uncharacterized membrane protein YphA (DoxX/SURF4 family)